MMSKTLIVTLEVDLDDLSPDEREEAAGATGSSPDDLPEIGDYGADEFAECFEGLEVVSEELFAGSNVFATITGSRVREAHFATAAETKE